MPKKIEKQASKKKIILVTGATSGIGGLLTEKLLQMNYEVRVILMEHPNQNPEWKYLPKGVKVYVADIRLSDDQSKKAMAEACKNVSIIFHLAASTSNYNNRYNELINTNVVGTENILRAYFDANPGNDELRFIFTSSVTVYGYRRPGETLTEDSEPMPKSAYSESKYMAEQIVKAFAEANSRLNYSILRVGVIYGKGYEHNFMKVFQLIKDKKLRYVGDGTNHLTFIHIDDVINGILIVLEKDRRANRTYNLTDGVAYTQKELFQKAAKFLNAEAPSKSVHPFLARACCRNKRHKHRPVQVPNKRQDCKHREDKKGAWV
jgi:nucleoside-diphosphate-sugar epimerase